MPRKARILLLTILTTLTLLFFLQTDNFHTFSQHQTLTPANATLGFGTILAISSPHSQRQPGLLWAANLTDLNIIIPPQPAWTEADLRTFRLDSGSTITEGSVRAWLGHLHALRWFLESGKETALAIEDDVDWDITVRSHQIPLLASATRSLLDKPSWTSGSGYWGHVNSWDILYPGHCDDLLPSPSNPFLSSPHLLYPDFTAPPRTLLHPDTSNFLRSLSILSQTRILHRTFAPFCTFAYAVNRRSAEKIVGEHAHERDGVEAYDVQLLEACRDGMRCYSVAPELFHHRDGGSEIAGVDAGAAEGGGDDEGLGKGTWNIRCGARHRQLWIDEDDRDGRTRAREVVRGMLEKAEGECLIDFVKAERSWRGCEWGECGAQS